MADGLKYTLNFSDGIFAGFQLPSYVTSSESLVTLPNVPEVNVGEFNLPVQDGRVFLNIENNNDTWTSLSRLVFSEVKPYYKYNDEDEWIEINSHRLDNDPIKFHIASFHTDQHNWFTQPATYFDQNLNKDILFKLDVTFTFTSVPFDGSYYSPTNEVQIFPLDPLDLDSYKSKFAPELGHTTRNVVFYTTLKRNIPTIRNSPVIPESAEVLEEIKFSPASFESDFNYKKISYEYQYEDQYDSGNYWYYAFGSSPENKDYAWYSMIDSTNTTSPKEQFAIFPNYSSYNSIKWFYKNESQENSSWVHFSDSNLEFDYIFNEAGIYSIKIEANNTNDNQNLTSMLFENAIEITPLTGRSKGKIALSVLFSPFTNNIISDTDKYYGDYLDIHDSFDETKDNSNSEFFSEEASLDKFYFGNIVDRNTTYNSSIINTSRDDKPNIVFDFDETKEDSSMYNYPLLYVPYSKFSNERVIVGSIANLNNKDPFNTFKIQDNKNYFCPRNVSIIDVENFGPLVDIETGEEE